MCDGYAQYITTALYFDVYTLAHVGPIRLNTFAYSHELLYHNLPAKSSQCQNKRTILSFAALLMDPK